jgi:hypothetical protein
MNQECSNAHQDVAAGVDAADVVAVDASSEESASEFEYDELPTNSANMLVTTRNMVSINSGFRSQSQ